MGEARTESEPWVERLREVFGDQVRSDLLTRGIHATDASFYQIGPAAVAWPRSESEVIRALEVASSANVPVTLRGAGTSLSGQTHGRGLILDVSRHLDRILSVDSVSATARVEPGVILQQLNDTAAPHGLMFAPDPATSSRATIGGVIGNNSSGTRSVRWGKTSDHVLGLRVALADGTVLELETLGSGDFSERARREGREGEIYRAVDEIVARHADEIRQRFPKVMRRVSGYALDALLTEREDRSLIDLVVGSEGTLAVVLEATVRLVPKPAATAVCVVHFDDVIESLRHIPRMLEWDPLAIEMLDDVILTEARRNAATRAHAGFFVGEPRAIQIVELDGSSTEEAVAKANDLAAALERERIGSAWPVLDDPERQRGAWETRRLGLGLISNVKGPRKGQAFIEDACVPVEHLADYTQRVLALCKEEETPVSVYGHASVGVLHTRPMLDLHLESEVRKMRRIAEACFEWVRELGGSWSGEHGDGLVRGEFVERAFGGELVRAFTEVKRVFDPQGLLNPGKLIDPEPMDENLRYGTSGYAEHARESERLASFRYRDQGGFVLAVEQCNGVGACRKLGSGTMCPSYMALRDEAHSTRGRANALRLALSGQLGAPADALASDELNEVLELCLSCKACKSECPNAVDMARLKADTLHLRHQKKGASFGTWLVGALPLMARVGSGRLAPVVNAVQRSRPFRRFAERRLGLDGARALPSLARRPLRRRLGDRSRRPPARRGRVVLFADTYSRFYEPQAAMAAIAALESLGYSVDVAQVGDSQRPRLSKGLLDGARRYGERVLRRLDRPGDEDVPVVCLEPSCASALADDLPDLVEDEPLGRRVASRVRLFDDFVLEHADEIELTVDAVFWHRHCHDRAVFALEVPRTIGSTEVIDSGAGCCGMAGSFGYEHHDLSLKIASERLVPNLVRFLERRAEERPQTVPMVVASGFSCRHQIRDVLARPDLVPARLAANVHVMHFAELASSALGDSA